MQLEAPRLETYRSFLIAGLVGRYTMQTTGQIPELWKRFVPYLDNIPGQIADTAYGVLCNSDHLGNTEYIAGVEVSDFSKVQPELARLKIPSQEYAVFTHRDNISSLQQTFQAIFNHWLTGSGYRAADAPVFEHYDERFDPHSGTGGFEIWVPITAKHSTGAVA